MAGNSDEPNNMYLDDLLEGIVFSYLDQPNIMFSSDGIKDFLFDDSDECQLQLIGLGSFTRSHRRIDKDHEVGQ